MTYTARSRGVPPVSEVCVRRLFHVTSVRNRDSITIHGLDTARMDSAPGIAGSRLPEADGCFLCVDDFEVDFFVRMNNTGGPVDVWAVDGIDERRLVSAPNGFSYLRGRVAPAQLSIVQSRVVGTSRRPADPNESPGC